MLDTQLIEYFCHQDNSRVADFVEEKINDALWPGRNRDTGGLELVMD